jgi:hypothetical protein
LYKKAGGGRLVGMPPRMMGFQRRAEAIFYRHDDGNWQV